MARKSRGKRYAKKDRYQQITDKIVDALEKGVAPWHCPWDRAAGMPHNGHTGHRYQGLNVFLCWASDFTDARWFTYNQVKKYGKSHVRKGEKGTPIFKWLFVEKKETDEDEDGNEVEKTKTIPIIKGYTVFNYEQVEWDPENMPKGAELKDIDPEAANAKAAEMIEAVGAEIRHGGARACYNPKKDVISMPLAGTFEDADSYWATLLHELTHWTGHETRCNRKLGSRFGAEAYAAEELVAEMGSAFLCADVGIASRAQHSGYIAHWIKMLKDDKYALFTAARLAREAVTLIKERAEAAPQAKAA